MTLDADTLEATDDLRDELEANARTTVDPRTIPGRFSLLKLMSLSPLHYWQGAQAPQDDTLAQRLGGLAGAAPKRGDALRFGTAVHAFLLGDPNTIARYSGGVRRGKAWDAFQADAAAEGAVEILNDREWTHATAVADAIRAHKQAMRLILDGTVREQRIEWTYNGRAFRSTPDARGGSSSGGRRHVTDLKTAISSEPATFTRTALRLFYHAQLWLYGEAMEANGEGRPDDAFIIAVEKSAPRPVSILRITDRALEAGSMLCRAWVERLAVSEATNEWPAYIDDEGVGTLDIWEPEDLGLEFNGKKVVL